MSAVGELELDHLDYADPQLRGARFHAELRELAARSWLAEIPLGYVVLDREAAEHFLRTRDASFPGARLAELFEVTEGPLHEEMAHNILHRSGADHRRLRNLVNPAFTPRAADRWRPTMRAACTELLERLAATAERSGRVRCELVEAFAKPYPARVIAEVMGAPVADAPRLHEWSHWIQRQFDLHALAHERPRIERACAELYAWADELIARRRDEPRDDLISTLIAAEQQGDRLSDIELRNLVLNVLVGGVDTTQSQLAHALRLFAEHPAQWAALGERPELAAAAVEEVLRYEPITPFTARICDVDHSYRGVEFPAGTVIMVCAFTANRDAAGPSPWRFDLTADRGDARTLTFGAGIHYCLGANLARAELEEALAFLAPRLAELRVDGPVELQPVTGIYGIDRLPLAFRLV